MREGCFFCIVWVFFFFFLISIVWVFFVQCRGGDCSSSFVFF